VANEFGATLFIMAKGKGGAPAPKKTGDNSDRLSSKKKAYKKRPKIFDAIKRRLVTKQ
jgi:hypothetical protein